MPTGSHRIRSALFAGLLAATLMLQPALGAEAADARTASTATVPADCDEQQAAFYSGMAKDKDASVYGARAIIQQEKAYLCRANSSSSAWVMLSADTETNPNSGLSAYAQLGYRNNGSTLDESGYHVFVQWTKSCFPFNCSGITYNHYIDPAPTGPENYEVYAEASSGHMVMKHDGVKIGETAYTLSNWWDSEYVTTYSGETKHLDTDMPGSSDNKIRFYQVQKFKSDGSIVDFPASAFSKIPGTTYACASGCRYGYDRYVPNNGDTGLKIWSN